VDDVKQSTELEENISETFKYLTGEPNFMNLKPKFKNLKLNKFYMSCFLFSNFENVWEMSSASIQHACRTCHQLHVIPGNEQALEKVRFLAF
jgi:hypothetical protein